jgi:hypothetical protein
MFTHIHCIVLNLLKQALACHGTPQVSDAYMHTADHPAAANAATGSHAVGRHALILTPLPLPSTPKPPCKTLGSNLTTTSTMSCVAQKATAARCAAPMILTQGAESSQFHQLRRANELDNLLFRNKLEAVAYPSMQTHPADARTLTPATRIPSQKRAVVAQQVSSH